MAGGPYAVLLDGVGSPQHLGIDTSHEGEQVRMDVYTGWATVDYSPGAADDIQRDQFLSLVPHAPMKIFVYPEGTVLSDSTVTAAPSSVADDGDAVVAVDSASVALESRTLPGVKEGKMSLILRANLAVFDATLHAFTYQITVLVPPGATPPEDVTLGQGTYP